MDDAVILVELEAQAQTMPAFEYAIGDVEQRWIGRTLALLTYWNSIHAGSVRTASRLLSGPLFDSQAATIRTTLYEAIEDLRLRVRHKPGGAFAANAVYDFFREFKNVVGLATRELFIIDAYLDDGVFTYLSAAVPGVSVRLMTKTERQPKLIPLVRAGQQAFRQQYQRQVETRETIPIHDRVVFVDGQTCYVLGASIKDAAQKAPTYLAPLSADLVQDKLAAYEAIWASATAI